MNHLAVIFRAIFFAAALLGTIPAAAQSERIENMKVELEAAWFETPDDQVLAKVVEKEEQQGRKFAPEEVAAEVEHITGQNLKRNCFTCRMRVLTPEGYKEIGALKKGDMVYSWDEENSNLVPNSITHIHVAENSAYGTLDRTPTGVRLEVSGSHPFLLPEEGLYEELGKIEAQNVLRGIGYGPREPCQALLQSRGDFRRSGKAQLFTLTVKRPPYNFIVEGLVVHNKPVQIL